ncbi:extracellular solute-binding protein [Paenibacillus cellulositrophicus]|uniref:extracellular solute-binding protein n=1 Tax=Paenibacillus cellulositrophicus TaxID=562959 RepID=UPI001266EB5A|nr:extracellular solute-binding protein [Paenibacillus cellulositrophicus]
MKKRIVWFKMGLFIILAATVVAGCAEKENQNSQESQKGGNGSKKMHMEFWTSALPVDHAFTKEYAENRFNVDIEHLVGGENYKEKMNLMIVSGEAPDYIKNITLSEYDKYVEQGQFAEIPVELLEKHAPKYMAWLKENTDEDLFKYFNRNGKNYTMPNIWTLGPSMNVLGIRQDWLDKLGINKKPETLAEFEDMLIKFRNDDPDHNGKKDTYGLTTSLGSPSDLGGLFSSVFGAFDSYLGIFYEKDGKITRGEIEPETKEALAVLKRWYDEQLIDPEFVINKSDNLDQKVFDSKVGMIQGGWWSFLPAAAFFDGKYVEKIPNAKWLLSSGPKGPNGAFGIGQIQPMSNTGLQFMKHMEKEPEKMIKYIEMIEAFNFDEDYLEVSYFGKEGVTYNKNGDSYEWIPPYDKKDEQLKFGIDRSVYHYDGMFNNYDIQAPFMTAPKYAELRKNAEKVGVGKYDILFPIHKPIYNEYFDRLDQYTLKTFIDFITGRRDLKNFDKFVSEWMSMGGDKVMKEAQEVYSQYNTKD